MGSDMGGKWTMSCYFGYHALALMYLHAETKCWLDEVQGSNHRSQAGQSNLICSFLEKKETALTAIDTWLRNNSYAKIRDIEDGCYVWRYMHPFASLLYGRSPVVRRMGAFSMANLMQGPENRLLLVHEEGESYASLQCSTWCKDKETQMLAREAMKEAYKDGVDPPSLQAICKFWICDNFDVVGRGSIKMLPRALQTKKEIVEAGFLTPLSEILRSPSGSIKIIELAIGCLQCCCSNYCLIERLIEENMDDAIINRCVSLLSLLWYEGGDIAKEATMSCYIGYHALALMYLHAETKCWLDEVQGSNHESQAGQSNLICSFLEKKETALTAIDTWLHNNSYAKIRDIEDGHYVWRYMHPFASLLYGRSPVVRRMGAFSMANLMQGPENRLLLVHEEGESYPSLQCSTWCKDKETQTLAREAMKEVYKDGVDPPSLQAICKFWICDNFDVVGRGSIKMLPRALQTKVVPFLH
ncbi:uncharacterized protein LOC134186985 isoform X2 [Corticium candelabrum]|uniref:uncharacterized protein LOC134186985 isoform X2 n=1 Tax=Corticium candelabrum TaxID=121492 RepID=UPI002E25D2F5|nr:uncharacterized protein LOC134186985 isoform X2 [Corticium candelabrum]XP_062511076.1 uncharacterized protein LOC134186985 isoform X2 [Corticium candelabrum]